MKKDHITNTHLLFPSFQIGTVSTAGEMVAAVMAAELMKRRPAGLRCETCGAVIPPSQHGICPHCDGRPLGMDRAGGEG